jgi:hypothetical protein
MDMYPASETNRLLNEEARQQRAVEQLLEHECACELEDGIYERSDYTRFTIEWVDDLPCAADEDDTDCYDELLQLRNEVNELTNLLKAERAKKERNT